MDYEKKYKEAFERAKIWQKHLYEVGDKDYGDELNYIFPELNESEDEKIRKALIRFHKSTIDIDGIKGDEIVAWLEKQGEQKPYGQREECVDCQFNYAGECKGSCAMKKGEKKLADKVEPKFKVGDWVMLDRPVLITKVEDMPYNTHQYWTSDDTWFGDATEAKLWTIQDAKDGDVFAFDNETIVIFKDLYNATTFHSYCHIEDGVFTASEKDVPDWWEGKGFQPATKEQRDLLFQKMKEAGYEWDADKKELKKIEQKPANEEMIETIRTEYEKGRADAIAEMQKDWSKEDEERIKNIISVLDWDGAIGKKGNPYQKEIDWLKSLKDRYTWKPSDEQMKALRIAAEVGTANDSWAMGILKGMYNELKSM